MNVLNYLSKCKYKSNKYIISKYMQDPSNNTLISPIDIISKHLGVWVPKDPILLKQLAGNIDHTYNKTNNMPVNKVSDNLDHKHSRPILIEKPPVIHTNISSIPSINTQPIQQPQQPIRGNPVVTSSGVHSIIPPAKQATISIAPQRNIVSSQSMSINNIRTMSQRRKVSLIR